MSLRQIFGRQYTVNKGSFFPYFNNSPLDLSRYQIFEKINEENYKDNSFIYAVRMSGKVSEESINLLRSKVKKRSMHQTEINDLAKEIGIGIRIYRYTYVPDDKKVIKENSAVRTSDKKQKSLLGKKDASVTLNLGLFNNHFFLIEKLDFTKHYFEHTYIKDEKLDVQYKKKRYTGSKWKSTNRESDFISSDQVIAQLFEKGSFIPMKASDIELVSTISYDDVKLSDYDSFLLKGY